MSYETSAKSPTMPTRQRLEPGGVKCEPNYWGRKLEITATVWHRGRQRVFVLVLDEYQVRALPEGIRGMVQKQRETATALESTLGARG